MSTLKKDRSNNVELTAAASPETGVCLRNGVNSQQALSPWDHPSSFLLLAVWFGLLMGLTEVCGLTYKRFASGELIGHGACLVWMAPLTDVLLFAAPGLLFSLLAWRRPRALWLFVAVLYFSFVYFMTLLSSPSLGLHSLALILLAGGLAVQTAALLATSPRQFYALARNTTVAMILVVWLMTAGVYGWQWSVERRMLASLARASPNAPNVLLIVLDTVRASSLSLYGYERSTTPRLERLAQNGVLFENAIAPAPWTLPSHASMFTGRYPYELTADWHTPLSDAHPTLAEVLRAHGYLTAGFVANVSYCSRDTGLDRGFLHYEDFLMSPGEILRTSQLGRMICESTTVRRWFGFHDRLGRKSAARVNQELLRWLGRQGGGPFFVFLNYFDVHSPYLPCEPFDRAYGTRSQEEKTVMGRWDFHPADLRKARLPEEIAVAIDAYDGCMAYLDHQLGLLLDELEKRGRLKNTLLIVTSDHGEQFGEHGLFLHGNSLYWPLLHVPLLVVFPGRVPAGERVSELVSLRDIPVTVVDLLGLNDTPFPGSSLGSCWEDTSPSKQRASEPLVAEVSEAPWLPEWSPNARGALKTLLMRGKQYIKRYDTDQEELYDLETDPLQKHNLTDSDEARALLQQFRQYFAQFVDGEHRAPDEPGEENGFDTAVWLGSPAE